MALKRAIVPASTNPNASGHMYTERAPRRKVVPMLRVAGAASAQM
ncbi:MAG: hypothetical protein PHO89_01225 [Methylacidiphilaceae bacterium]|nr:hypothetical protein [Candidatus Methylacidiphilaceae bacterium]